MALPRDAGKPATVFGRRTGTPSTDPPTEFDRARRVTKTKTPENEAEPYRDRAAASTTTSAPTQGPESKDPRKAHRSGAENQEPEVAVAGAATYDESVFTKHPRSAEEPAPTMRGAYCTATLENEFVGPGVAYPDPAPTSCGYGGPLPDQACSTSTSAKR